MLLQRLSETILVLGTSLILAFAFVLAAALQYGRRTNQMLVSYRNQIHARSKQTRQF